MLIYNLICLVINAHEKCRFVTKIKYIQVCSTSWLTEGPPINLHASIKISPKQQVALCFCGRSENFMKVLYIPREAKKHVRAFNLSKVYRIVFAVI